MSNQINFLLDQALNYLRSGNLSGAELLLKQIIKVKPNNSEALRLYSVICAQKGENNIALQVIQKSIAADRRNGIAYSNQGNIQLNLGLTLEAVASYEKSIQLVPNYAEAYSNLGNAFQALGESTKAIEFYKEAISIDGGNPEFHCNLGNAYWKLDLIKDARKFYESTISLAPGHVNALHNLAHLDLREFNFMEGWPRYESRWHITEDKPIALSTSKPRWDGVPRNNRLFVWAEQGIGDQILHGSMLRDLEKYPQTKIISIDKKLVSIFQRSFPNFQVVDKSEEFPDSLYDEQIPIASLGQFLRPNIQSFNLPNSGYFPPLDKSPLDSHLVKYFGGRINCGISWKSNRAKLGQSKSISLDELAPILKMSSLNFINLQYGDVKSEIMTANTQLDTSIQVVEEVDLYEDIVGLQSIIEACDIVVTTSNTTAHLAGMSGKETLLFLPMGNSRFWYWHDVDGASLWYPSIRIFKQEKQGDWSQPIEAAKAYLESRFAI
ncbi:tetratricopeptide repeat protein [Polynucleobacter necessarius]|uniref:tetratricopeptide repeat protein n=1 Tax=Polynucleobacter necessarius TaxID=576610 RepID=UPI0013B05429|nr:tetratricopeptide repeat protein [Polynucleobacter necessarius]